MPEEAEDVVVIRVSCRDGFSEPEYRASGDGDVCRIDGWRRGGSAERAAGEVAVSQRPVPPCPINCSPMDVDALQSGLLEG